MAILVHYQLVREDTNQVEYRFGFPEMDRLLAIEKASSHGRPVDGTEDHKYRAVCGKILRQHREQGAWPPGGTYAA
jgi:hypothetical protein